MRELKIPGQVRQLANKWRCLGDDLTDKAYDQKHSRSFRRMIGESLVYYSCASELEAALKRPVTRARIKAKRGKKV